MIVLVALGFPIALIFAWAFELTPEGIKRTEDLAPGESLPRQTGRKLTAVITALAVIAAGLLAFLLFQPSGGKAADLEKSPDLYEFDAVTVMPVLSSRRTESNDLLSCIVSRLR